MTEITDEDIECIATHAAISLPVRALATEALRARKVERELRSILRDYTDFGCTCTTDGDDPSTIICDKKCTWSRAMKAVQAIDSGKEAK